MGQDAVWTPLSRMHRRQHIGYITYLVRDYDEAIGYYTRALGFRLVEDRPQPTLAQPDKRWVLVAPLGADTTGACQLLPPSVLISTPPSLLLIMRLGFCGSIHKSW